jgi:hypothetical protein
MDGRLLATVTKLLATLISDDLKLSIYFESTYLIIFSAFKDEIEIWVFLNLLNTSGLILMCEKEGYFLGE